MDPKLFDMNSIFSVAQQIAKDIKINNPELSKDSDNVDMSSIIQQVTKSVSNVVTPDFLDKMSNNSSPNDNHRRKNNKSIKNSSSKTPDINFEVPITLYDAYYGKTKKINVKVDRLKKTEDGKLKLVKEKNKLHIEIEKGVVDGTVLKFEGEGDQKPGFKTGDINVTIRIEETENFERDDNNIIYHHFCSLSECYNLKFTFEHINGNTYKVLSNSNTFNFNNPVKLIRGLGMPISDSNSEQEYGDLIILLHFALPFKLEEDQVNKLAEIFPPMIKTNGAGENTDEIEDTLYAEDPEDDPEDDGEDDDDDDEDCCEENDEDDDEENEDDDVDSHLFEIKEEKETNGSNTK